MPRRKPQHSKLVASLPVELLQAIFEIHVVLQQESPYKLRLVSRQWCQIVDTTPVLWSRIFFGQQSPQSEGKIGSRSIGDAVQAVKRTQNYPHELTLDLRGQTATLNKARDGLDWLALMSSGTSRCWSLNVVGVYPSTNWTLATPNLPELRELTISEDCNIIVYSDFTFLASIQQHSLRLSHLSMSSRAFEHLESNPRLLRRLTKLTLTGNYGVIPLNVWKLLKNLEEVTVTEDSLLREFVTGVSPSLSHLTLDLYSAWQNLEAYSQITHLILKFGVRTVSPIYSNSKARPIMMPKLEYLEIHKIWSPICTIKASNLNTLVLRGARPSGEKFLGMSDRILCRPKILYIDMGKNIIDVHLATRLAECWSDIEELHLTYVVRDSSISFSLRTALEGNSLDAPVCRHLKRLCILMPPPGLNAKTRKMATLGDLRKLAQIRRYRKLLESGHCGWFQTSSSDLTVMENACRRWWDAEWFTLFE